MIQSLPSVSVIVPTFNCANILGGCLDSLVAQDYPSLEILVMDGGSKDETVEVARGYGDRIRIHVEKDEGIYDAMNKGIAIAQGEWLFFIGADDSLVDPQVVSDMMASEPAQREETLLIYGDVNSKHMGARYRGRTELSEIIDHNICHQAAFYRRRLFEVEAPYDLRYRLYADWDLNLKVYAKHPGTHRYVERLITNYTGGASTKSLDPLFVAERESNVWRYARQVRGSRGREVRAVLYARAIAQSKNRRRKMMTLTIRSILDSSILMSILRRRVANPWVSKSR